MNQIPHNYNPDAECLKWLEFIEEAIHKEDIPVLQEAFGYTLFPKYFIHKAFLLVGKGGNGKGVVLDTLRYILGANNVSARELQELNTNRFALADLYGKLANIAGDIPSTRLTKTGNFKKLTGQDLIEAEKKHQNSFNFENYAKLWFSCNQVPQTSDDTDAFFQGGIIFTFPRTFRGTDKEDKHLRETLQEESEGIIAWAIEGLKRLLENDGFSYSASTEEVREYYARLSDSVYAFYQDCLVEDSESQIPKDDLYALYVTYCAKLKIDPVHKNTFAKNLPRCSGVIRVSRPRIKGRRVMAWQGVAYNYEAFEKLGISLDTLTGQGSIETSLDHPENQDQKQGV